MVRIIAFLLVFSISGAGCSPADAPRSIHCPTSGAITYNGKPPSGAIITFHPLATDGDSSEPPAKPRVKVQKDGSFRLDGENKEDGLTPGGYALTIVWRPNAACPDLFRDRYSDEAVPILWATIEKGFNQLPLIELTGPEVDAENPLGPDH